MLSANASEFAAQADGVPAALDLLRVTGQQVFDVALQPATAGSDAEVQGGLRKATSQEPLDIAAQVRRVIGWLQIAGCHPVEERYERPEPELFAHGHPEQRDTCEATGPGPDLALEIPANRPSHEKSSRIRASIHGAFRRGQDARNDLPFVDQGRFGQAAHRRIGVGSEIRRPPPLGRDGRCSSPAGLPSSSFPSRVDR